MESQLDIKPSPRYSVLGKQALHNAQDYQSSEAIAHRPRLDAGATGSPQAENNVETNDKQAGNCIYDKTNTIR